MKDERIGVWFSVALVILLLSAALGWQLGAKVAVYRYRSDQHRSLGSLSASEHLHLESALDELQAISMFRLTVLVSQNDAKLWKTLPERVEQFENFGRKVGTAEAKPVFQMNLALADLVAAMADEQNNNRERASHSMQSAQSLFQSLGWRDHSESTLRALAQRQLDDWKLKAEGREGAK